MSVFALASGGEMIFPAKLLKLARVEAKLNPHAIGTSEGVTSGAVQTTSLPGGRWEFTCYWDGVQGADGEELQSFFRQVGRRVFKLPMGAANPPDRPAGFVAPTAAAARQVWKSAANVFPEPDESAPVTIDLGDYAQADLTGDVEITIRDAVGNDGQRIFKFAAALITEGESNAYEFWNSTNQFGFYVFWDNGVLKVDDRRDDGTRLDGGWEFVNVRFQVTEGGPPAAAIQVGHNPSPMARNAPVVAATAGLLWRSAANVFPVEDGAMPLTIDLDGAVQADLQGDVEVGISLSPFKFSAALIGADSANAYEFSAGGFNTGYYIFWDNGALKIDLRRDDGGSLNTLALFTSFRFQALTGVVSSEEWVTLAGQLYQIEEDVTFGSGGAAVAVSPFFGGREPTAGKDIAVELGDAALARVVISDENLPSFERGRKGLVEGLTVTLREV